MKNSKSKKNALQFKQVPDEIFERFEKMLLGKMRDDASGGWSDTDQICCAILTLASVIADRNKAAQPERVA